MLKYILTISAVDRVLPVGCVPVVCYTLLVALGSDS